MKEFTIELNKLLDKYPDLGEFTITVRPRLIIQTAQTITAAPASAIALGKVVQIPAEKLQGVLSLEKSVNKTRMAELAKAAQIE